VCFDAIPGRSHRTKATKPACAYEVAPIRSRTCFCVSHHVFCMKNIRLKLLGLAAVSALGSAVFALPVSADVPGILKGTMRISPTCPVSPASPNACEHTYAHAFRLLLMQGETLAEELHVHRNGKFVGVVQPGVYVIDISPNYWRRPCPIGASCVLSPGSANVPAQVVIADGTITTFNVEIDTGIR
jgi:hypothetical protein